MGVITGIPVEEVYLAVKSAGLKDWREQSIGKELTCVCNAGIPRTGSSRLSSDV